MPVSEEKHNALLKQYQQRRQTVEGFLRAIDDVLSGMPESVACQINNVKISSFRNFMRHNTDGNLQDEPKSWTKLDYFSREDTFVKDLLGNDGVAHPDFWGAFEFVSTKLFDERDKKILDLRYKEAMTLDEISEALDGTITRERVRQRLEKMLRLMRHPRYQKYFVCGMEVAAKMDQEDNLKQTLAEHQATIDQLSRECSSIILQAETYQTLKDMLQRLSDGHSVDMQNFMDILSRIYGDNAQRVSGNNASNVGKMPVEYLSGLSLRTLNALRRGGFQTIQDVIDAPFNRLRALKGLGEVGLKEIGQAVRPFRPDLCTGGIYDEWICLTDKEPEFERYVLVQDYKGRVYVMQLTIDLSDESHKPFFEDRFASTIEYDKIVAWMPLPTPYGVNK